MDVYAFIDPEAIAGHCRQIGHVFTPLQTAYLIDRSHRHTIAQKHRAFRWVMENMPDEEVDLRSRGADGERTGKTVRLRWFLEQYSKLQAACPKTRSQSGQARYWEEGLTWQERDILCGFDEVCFACPTPFQKGDIVWAPTYEAPAPFVFCSTWHTVISRMMMGGSAMIICMTICV